MTERNEENELEKFLRPSCVYETGTSELEFPINSILEGVTRICKDNRKEDCCYWNQSNNYCGYRRKIYRLRKDGVWISVDISE
jgi:hypothetical protein